MRQVIIFVAISAANLVGQFFSWTFTTGNVARPMPMSGVANVVYAITSFPMTVIMKDGYNNSFWPLTISNAVVWGFVWLGILNFFRRRRQREALP
jgi:hypothetical protein